jgi:hypothetical protein
MIYVLHRLQIQLHLEVQGRGCERREKSDAHT